MAENIQLRINEETRMFLKLAAGEIQAKTGKTLSWGDALWVVLQECRPEMTERAVSLLSEDQSE